MKMSFKEDELIAESLRQAFTYVDALANVLRERGYTVNFHSTDVSTVGCINFVTAVHITKTHIEEI